MQINSIQVSNQMQFGMLKIRDGRLNEYKREYIKSQIQEEVEKLDGLGFDIIIRNEPYPIECFETPNCLAILQDKENHENLDTVSIIYRDIYHSFDESIKVLKGKLNILCDKLSQQKSEKI